jgi:hypothetical protein
MQFFSIRQILLIDMFFLILIWGGIFTLVLTDHSYRLFVPTVELPTWLQKLPDIDLQPAKESPWRQDLFMGMGDINNLGGKSFLIHGTATPSAVVRNDSVVVYFNYFPPQNRQSFGKIFWIKSTDQGKKWSDPAPIVINDLPSLASYPISPQVVVLPSGKIKLYFLAKATQATHNSLYAALSNDGVNFTYDPTTSFQIENESLTAFTVAILGERMHLVAFTDQGALSQTAYNAISYDTKVFTRLADLKIEDSFYGQSHLTTQGGQLYLIGSSNRGLWKSSSNDGNSWSSPSYYGLPAQNPSAVYTGEKYLLFYTDNPAPQTSADSTNQL